jgi:hypothetical protein
MVNSSAVGTPRHVPPHVEDPASHLSHPGLIPLSRVVRVQEAVEVRGGVDGDGPVTVVGVVLRGVVGEPGEGRRTLAQYGQEMDEGVNLRTVLTACRVTACDGS